MPLPRHILSSLWMSLRKEWTRRTRRNGWKNWILCSSSAIPLLMRLRRMCFINWHPLKVIVLAWSRSSKCLLWQKATTKLHWKWSWAACRPPMQPSPRWNLNCGNWRKQMASLSSRIPHSWKRMTTLQTRQAMNHIVTSPSAVSTSRCLIRSGVWTLPMVQPLPRVPLLPTRKRCGGCNWNGWFVVILRTATGYVPKE